MKKTKLFLLITIFALLFSACESEIDQVMMSSSPSKPAIADLTLGVSFTIANADSSLKFSWGAADFGFPSSVTYSLQMSPKSDFSSNVATLFNTQALKGTAKIGDVNALLLSWNYAIGTAVTVYYRVGASVSSSVPTVYSDVKSRSLTPYDAVINYPMMYVPGGYQGWSPGAINGRLYSYDFSNNIYQGIIRIKDGTNANSEFKLTTLPNWDVNFGGTLTKSGNNYTGTLEQNGPNYVVISGVYSITVNLNAKTIALNKTDDWGIIGSAVPPYDWSRDVDMFYNGQRKMWEIIADFRAGEFKFRANDGWDLNYGGSGGTLSAGGANISLATAGNYTIRFDPVKLTYTVNKN